METTGVDDTGLEGSTLVVSNKQLHMLVDSDTAAMVYLETEKFQFSGSCFKSSARECTQMTFLLCWTVWHLEVFPCVAVHQRCRKHPRGILSQILLASAPYGTL